MKKIDIYEEAMCCSTGVSSPSTRKELIRTTLIERQVNAHGKAKIYRHNLAQDPEAFVTSKLVTQMIQDHGVAVLPVTLLDGTMIKSGQYPSIEEFSDYLSLDLPMS
ncbi:arsenite efflux transporter metallochaperone ArsD [Loigolactobacillus backii]|uniref:Uncharacterized protein n=1 Tax=Loigolactobacillus backii TaxID=375175 RepID=A0A192H0F1_9LACO|nr:arsenite efflux transporter metallochaperone ArsD [Loigolactobacillus backii]ANK61441.1 hypothetical protein AYR53_00905 [Loigolactobacillus backii]ANK69360.1 hypothetical protein AYR56_03810 [Loigolactobacillus backii]MDA5387782.1 arsenite efflux transporter metallochaperone ArsD [Loigolactobacillus backii]MDA5390888.1 arsenite efflux transporter metallochaperone ArsD [Loigolactobacillus backii]PIO84191.1 arsenical resistance operon transcriptional repressor ArsD [Loigolactobacillus backii